MNLNSRLKYKMMKLGGYQELEHAIQVPQDIDFRNS